MHSTTTGAIATASSFACSAAWFRICKIIEADASFPSHRASWRAQARIKRRAAGSDSIFGVIVVQFTCSVIMFCACSRTPPKHLPSLLETVSSNLALRDRQHLTRRERPRVIGIPAENDHVRPLVAGPAHTFVRKTDGLC